MRRVFVTYYSLLTCFDRCCDGHDQGSLQDYKESKNRLKCVIEPLSATKNVSNLLLSFNIGLFTAKILQHFNYLKTYEYNRVYYFM